MRGILIVATEPEAARRRCILLSVKEAVRAAREEEEGGGGCGVFAGEPLVMVDMMRRGAVKRKKYRNRMNVSINITSADTFLCVQTSEV